MPLALVVEDNRDLLEMFSLGLELAGWTVERATDVDAAALVLEQRRPDVVITDLSMPGADGQTLVALVRARYAGERLPIVVVSGHAEVLLATAPGEGLPACHIVPKPLMPDRLVALVESAVDGCGSGCRGARSLNPKWRVSGCGLSRGHPAERPA